MSRNAPARFNTCVLVLLFLLSLAGLAGCGEASSQENADSVEQASAEPGDGEEEKPKPEKKKKKKERSTSVTVSPVVRGDLVQPVIAEGSIRARQTTELKFEISGRITKVWVREGQRVKKGQTLVSLDDREYQLGLEEAWSRYLQGLGQLAVEEDGYASEGVEHSLTAQTQELAQMEIEGLITRQERLDRELQLGMEAVRDGAYRRELLEVRSGLATARADVSRLKLDLERTAVISPFNGVITGLRLNSGEVIRAGDPVCRLVDDVNIEADVGVLESDLGHIEVGRPAFLRIPALQRTVPVKVDVISPDIDRDSRTCRVLMRLRNRDGVLKPGMFAQVSVAGKTFSDRLLVPNEAVLTRDGRPVVFKVEDNRAKWVYVQLGERNDHLVEITRVDQGGPLDPDTLVVVDNHLTLTHDAKIKVKKTLAISDPWMTLSERN